MLWGVEKEKLIVKLILWFNWFNFGVGILCNVLLILASIGYSRPGYNFIHQLWDFLGLRDSPFSIWNYTYVIVFVTGLIIAQRGLNVLLTNGVKKSDDQSFFKWIKFAPLFTIVEWIFVGYASYWTVYTMRQYFFPSFGWIMIYVFLRMIYPVVSYFIIFRFYFYVKLYLRSDDYKTIESQTDVV